MVFIIANYCNCIVQMINNSTNSKSGSNTGCVRMKAMEEVYKLMVTEAVAKVDHGQIEER